MYETVISFLQERNMLIRAADLLPTGADVTEEASIRTLEAVVKLVQVAVLRLFPTDDPVVGDVAVGVGGRFPLQDDLRGGVGGGDGVQRHGGP